jgi:hypothetical protein
VWRWQMSDTLRRMDGVVLSRGHSHNDLGVRVLTMQLPVQVWYGTGYRTGGGSQ